MKTSIKKEVEKGNLEIGGFIRICQTCGGVHRGDSERERKFIGEYWYNKNKKCNCEVFNQLKLEQ